MRVMVAGGGIGGLTAAIALRRVGAEVVVFERARQIRAVGAGLLLAANAVKALHKIGLADQVREVGVPGTSGDILSWRGDALVRLPLGELKRRTGADTVAVHRADLQEMLLREVGEGVVLTGAELTDFEQDADGGEERGEMLVGADGLRSRVRARLFGESDPTYAGYTSWRGIARGFEPEALPRGRGFETWGRGRRFGAAHLGRGRVYWYATWNAPEGEDDAPEGAKARLLSMLGGWHEPVEDLVRATEGDDILKTDLYDRGPLGRWGESRVTLLGDAAHPMTPNLGQGACQAMEDAVALARSVKEYPQHVEATLRRYEAERKDRTAAIVRRSRSIGQLENPLVCRARDAIVSAIPDRLQLTQIEEIVAYET